MCWIIILSSFGDNSSTPALFFGASDATQEMISSEVVGVKAKFSNIGCDSRLHCRESDDRFLMASLPKFAKNSLQADASTLTRELFEECLDSELFTTFQILEAFLVLLLKKLLK